MPLKRILLPFSRFINVLEAPTSIIQKQGEDSLTYLNKGKKLVFPVDRHRS